MGVQNFLVFVVGSIVKPEKFPISTSSITETDHKVLCDSYLVCYGQSVRQWSQVMDKPMTF